MTDLLGVTPSPFARYIIPITKSKRARFFMFILLSLAFIAVTAYLGLSRIDQLQNEINKLQQKVSQQQEELYRPQPEVMPGEEYVNYFQESVVPELNISLDFDPRQVNRAFPFTVSTEHYRTWLVEINTEPLTYYLVSTEGAKKLAHVGFNHAGVETSCEIQGVDYIKALDHNPRKKLPEENGYIIIQNNSCNTYGGAAPNISIFELDTGDKVKFQGHIRLKGHQYEMIDPEGSMQGRVSSVFQRTDNPIVIVEMGSFNTSPSREEVEVVGFFDLRTGRLLNLVKLDDL